MTDYSVISSYVNKDKVEDLVSKLEALNKTCYNFCLNPADPDDPHAPPAEQMKQRYKTTDDFFNDPYAKWVFETDLKGLLGAEKVILLLPAGKSSHIEAGIAYGHGKHLILIGKPEEPDSLYFIFNERHDTVDNFLASLT